MTESIDGDLTTDVGVEQLISWHKKCAEKFAMWEATDTNVSVRRDWYVNKVRHLATAELLAELVELMNDHECPYGHDCQPD